MVINMDSALCPLCHCKDLRILFRAETVHSIFCIIQCRQCNLARTYPFPDDDVLHVHDTFCYYGKNESKFIPVLQYIRDRLSKIRARRYLSMISTSIQSPRILDIGCADGRLLNSFLEYGCDCYGVEHLFYPKNRFLNSDRIKYFVGDLESLDLKERSFDIIILWHVLEHMDNPDAVINRVFDLLSPNGLFVLAVPNFSGMDAKIFKQLWFHLNIPWHKYHFTEKFLHCLVEKNSFQIVKSTTFCLEQGIYGIIQSILNFMRWPKNELYEAMKGIFLRGRLLPLLFQSIIAVILLMPCTLICLIASMRQEGSVLKLILRKNRNS